MAHQAIQLPITLDGDPGRRQRCARCLEDRLARRPGIRAVRLVAPDPDVGDDAGGFVELDYDASVVSLATINGYLRSAGTCFGPSIAHVVLQLRGVASPRHEHKIQTVIERLPGVRCRVSYASQTMRLEFNRELCALPDIVRRLEDLGVAIRPRGADAMGSAGMDSMAALDREEASASEGPTSHWLIAALREQDVLCAVVAGIFLIAGFLVHQLGGPEQGRIALLLVSYVFGGYYPARDLIQSLRHLKLDIDLLMFAAAFGAAWLGHHEEGAMLLFLFSLGGAGERLAMNRARRAIQSLARVAPRTALLLAADGSRREVPVEDLRPGDHIAVAPGQQVPADGQVLEGASAIDQSPITGESVPADKAPGDPVFAGTINGDGALTVEVSKLAADNTIARVVRLVQEAQTTKSTTQMFTDRVEQWYVPLVVVATVGLIVVPPLAGWRPSRENGAAWAGWFYQAMAFLTAASPCALAIGTPAAVLSGIARAARGGVLIKGGMHLESLGRLRVLAFDKTGTLTQGQPAVTDVVALADDVDASRLLALAASVERASRHPIAEAIVNEAEARGCAIPPSTAIDQEPGVGIEGDVNGCRIRIARPSSIAADLPGAPSLALRAVELEQQGRTVVAIADTTRCLGLIAVADRPRPEAAPMLAALRRLGIRHTIMLTGDNRRTAAAIAQRVGVDDFLAELLPQDKLTQVRRLDERYGRVAMVGDGINDAPAMANATVGIAIGGALGAGSDIAMETADVALLAGDLGKLPEAIGVSRFARRIIVQNLFIALGVIAVLAPLAALGLTPISTAVLFHEGSTVLVVLNALRILALGARTTPA